ncbi:MAG TPA: ABC transporter ATP-binding protein [Vicinamibacterales bacterium]|nr:ABC transporter ATP-binding protein [Vicinamibacterales bacterium]
MRMSSDVLVRVERVSKKFCRTLKRSLWYGLKDTAADIFGRRPSDQLRTEEFWAVDNVSLELARGECLGLIGRNGAGKTTLLKMLNGLIKPDTGRIELAGRVGALISLGAGFNPILTGRENIYVNGSVLGLTKKEIDSKFSEIVEFAEVGDFIDMPVQSYSAGMHVRLGFAVATAIKPDVLLLDEVLAVGDVAFRAKCYERLAHIRDSAAFVLVSHDTDQIARVCSKVLVLERGTALYLGDVGEGIRAYQELARQHMSMAPHEHTAAGTVASIASCDDTIVDGGTLNVSLSVTTNEGVEVADVRVVLWGDDGLAALDAYTRTQGSSFDLQPGCNVLTLVVGPLRLKRGSYAISIAVLDRTNNRHLYWGDRIRTVDVDGATAGAVSYTPPLVCTSISSGNDPVPPSTLASSACE